MRHLVNRSAVVSFGLAFTVGLAAGAFGVAAADGVWRVAQRGRNFDVPRLSIAAGDTIRFSNDDEYLHQIYVKSPEFTFDSAEQAPGQVIEVRFRNAGTYEVRCRIHPKMLLVVLAQ